MKKYLRVNEVAEQLNVSPSAVRVYANNGTLKHDLTPHGHRVFKQEHINEFLGKTAPKHTVFYTRSSTGDPTLLANQITALTKTYGDPQKVYTDKASGLNENRKGLNKLIEDAQKGEITQVCITQKDRLTRFGYSYLEKLFHNLGIEIAVLGETDTKTPTEELLQDFMSLLASFSGKFYRLRGYKQKKQMLATAGAELEKTHQ